MTPQEVKDGLPKRLEHLSLSVSLLSGYCGVDASQISRWLRGRERLTFENTQKIDHVMRMLEKLATAVSPVPVHWFNVHLVLALSEKLHQGKLKIRVTDEDSVLIAGGVNALAGK
jgi:hypothetical protein